MYIGSSDAEQSSAAAPVGALRVPGDVASRFRRRPPVARHDAGLHRPVLRRNSPGLRQLALRGRRGAELCRPVLRPGDSLHVVVHARGDRPIYRLSVQDRLLEGLQERRRRDGGTAVLRDALQRPVDDELLQRQVERLTVLPARHPTHPGIQVDETFRRLAGRSGLLFDVFCLPYRCIYF